MNDSRSDYRCIRLGCTWVQIFWTEGTDHGDASDHTLTLPHCVITGSLAEGDPDTVSISLTSYANFPTDIT